MSTKEKAEITRKIKDFIGDTATVKTINSGSMITSETIEKSIEAEKWLTEAGYSIFRYGQKFFVAC